MERPRPPELQVQPRGRVRQALVCPYCRDQVGRRGAVGCAGPACGAVYHAACWEEVRAELGRCAIPGCGHTAARPLGVWGYWARLVRLLLAALLFARRAATHAAEVAVQVEREGRSLADRLGPWGRPLDGTPWERENRPVTAVPLLLGLGGAALACAQVVPEALAGGISGPGLAGLLAVIGGGCLLLAFFAFALVFHLVWLPALFLVTRAARLGRRVFAGELAALERGAAPATGAAAAVGPDPQRDPKRDPKRDPQRDLQREG